MLSKNRLIVLIFLLGLSVFFFFWNGGNGGSSGNFSCEFADRSHANDLKFVNHALCRMRCREIDERLVREVYREGEVNCRKSGLKKGAPRYAIEKEDRRGDRIRVIIEDDYANDKHIVITVIRLGKEDICECS